MTKGEIPGSKEWLCTFTLISGLISSVPCAASRAAETGSQALELQQPALGVSQEGSIPEQHSSECRA